MNDLNISINSRAAPISIGNISLGGGPIAIEDLGIRLPGPKGDPGVGAGFTVTAGEAIGGHRIISLNDDGDAEYPTDYATAVGLTLNAASFGGSVTVATTGPITEPSWSWTPEQPIFLSGDGQMTQTTPTSGTLLQVGTAISATSMFVRFGQPIYLD